MHSLRDRYESSVKALAVKAEALRQAGCGAEAIARALHAERIALAEHYKRLTPEPLRTRIYERTQSLYGNCAGPSIDYLRARGKTWEQIIAGAQRPSAPISIDPG